MSSVVNKSKNKFVPKAKVRPRPGAAFHSSPSNPALPSPSKPSQPPEEPPAQPAPPPVPEPVVALSQLETRAETPVAELEPPRHQVSVPEIWTKRGNRVPSIRQTSMEASSSSSRSGVPIVHPSSSQGIPRVRAAAPEEVPTAQLSSTEGSLEALGVANTRPNVWLATVLGGTVDTPVFRDSGIDTAQETQGVSQGDVPIVGPEGPSENIDEGESSTTEKGAKTPRKRKARAAKDGIKKRRTTQRRHKAAASGVGGVEEAQGEQGEKGSGQGIAGGTESNVEGDNSDNSLYEDPQKSNEPKKTRRPRKSAAKKASNDPKEPNKPNEKRPGGHHRAPSPEDGEQREITPSIIKMKDLCRDIRIGRKSRRFIELEQLDWTKLASDQKAAKVALEVRQAAGEEAEQETAEERIERLDNERQSLPRAGAPQMRMVNGELVLDQESIQVNSHERNPIDEESMEVVEENTAFRRITSATYSKHKRSERWDTEETGKFYNALSMFGTDFEIISRLFPGRNRQQLRKKYLNEERKDPQRITDALRTRVPTNVAEYSEMAELEIGDPQLVEDELEKIREAHEAEEEAAIGHAAAMERERQENANAAMRAGDDAAAAAADQSKKGRKRKGAKDRGGTSHGGEEILSMSREEYEAERLRELAEAEEL
ncbi:hypothetical protein C7212DRAFT_360384 [Tuber magnatum]|uniref:Myb-like domain-containing protein n=1 Tax=Tuber magnatum TaxID=42249 RepID=A0A317SBX5_9PEZI|nr:hypothetical protein C7212DRAFT_360384 [Tuber magnatum]